MTRKARIGMLVAALALAAEPGAAQQWVYYNACGTAEGTSLRICASADVSLVGNTLVMRVWNMEVAGGTGVASYSSEFGGWHTITSVGLDHRAGRLAAGQLAEARYVFGGGASDYQMLSLWRGVDDGARNPLRVELGSSTEGHREGIVGCTDPGPVHAGHVQTCDSYGFMPFVQFTFDNVHPNMWLGSYDFSFHGWQMVDNHTAKVSGPGVSTEVVPEPITMVLLGSGLLGVGGVGLRRRRKGEPLGA